MEKKLYAVITPGSRAEFDMLLSAAGRPFNLATLTSAKLVFRNAAGLRTEVTLTVPGSSPGSGVIRVVIPAASTLNADTNWKNADLEMVQAGDTIIRPLTGKFDVQKRNVPAA